MAGFNATQHSEIARMIDERMGQLALGQQQQTQAMIDQGLRSLNQVQMDQLQAVKNEIEAAGQQYAGTNTKFQQLVAKYTEDLMEKQRTTREYLQMMENKTVEMTRKLTEEFEAKQLQIDELVQQINTKHTEI